MDTLACIYLVIALLILPWLPSCSKAKPEIPKADPSAEVVDAWQKGADRLPRFAPDGFLVSLGAQLEPRNQGDSLIWTGVTLSAVDCAHGSGMDRALQGMVATLHGGLWRHPSLPAAISLDGALGFYLGVTHRILRCNGAAEWRPLLELHLGKAPFLNQGVMLEEPFYAVRDAVLSLVGLTAYPDSVRVAAVAEAAAALAEAPKGARATGLGSDACFRPHLGLLALQIIEATGGHVGALQRDRFCAAADGYDLPTLDHWCGRGDLKAWAAGWQPNVWQYRHQRCPAWESPDGDGLEHPGADYLRGLADAYRFRFN